MKRVHRNLTRDEVEALRERLSSLVPAESASVPELLRIMRLVARKSQAEYARMCGVAPRVLASIEGGVGRPTVETLGKLLSPFGYRVGVVTQPNATATGGAVALDSRRNASEKQKSVSNNSQVVGQSALSRALKKDRRR